ncbi:hypothetical protein AaE_008706 [Aphanomyces astaci]|uniref:Reverse transcriptase domain-containing protein n=1 Tax=Aphanomyces astaci TaxID=112090 RepID=A0A6A5A6Q2_APHAT|nr:hypothetical protein AaE_008706 [Aphanomyces astaci]
MSSFNAFVASLRAQEIRGIAMISIDEELDLLSTPTADDSVLPPPAKSQTWDSLCTNPFFDLLREFADVFPDEVPSRLPVDKGVQHEIDRLPGTKYCVTRQWPLPHEQVEAIAAFFAARKAAGYVRKIISTHSSPTFCVKKPNGKWHIVHAFNKLNSASIPAQTPIPRKNVIIDGMGRSSIFSTIDLRDGFYQILMRLDDEPKTAVSTPCGMLWERLVMPQGLSNAPTTLNRMVTAKFRALHDFAPSYFDDIYIHRQPLRTPRYTAATSARFSNVDEIPVLGDLVGVRGCRADPDKIQAIVDWPTPSSVNDLRRWLATYLHKYSANFADLAQPLFRLLVKNAPWVWEDSCQSSFDALKTSLQRAPILALPDFGRPFSVSVVCDASKFAIGCSLMQADVDGRAHPVSYQSRQLLQVERSYPVHALEILSMKYAFIKFRIYLLGSKPFVIYTDHASLRTATNSPHISQRME